MMSKKTIVVTVLTFLLLVLIGVTSAFAANATLNPAHIGATNPGFSTGSCPTPPAGQEGWWSWHFIVPGDENFTSLSVTFEDAGTFSTNSFPGGVFVASPDNSHAYIWTPTPDRLLAASGTTDGTRTQFNLSHVCGGTYNLPVEKTAVTTFTRTYDWGITKGPNGDYVGFIGDSWTHTYDIALEQSYIDSDWAVSGQIKITNPTPVPFTLTGVSDEISGVGPVTVSCPVTFPSVLAADNGELTCTYSSALPNGDARVNTAYVTTTFTSVSGSDTADVTFGDPTTEVNGTVNVTDDYGTDEASDDLSFGPFSGDGGDSYDREFVCPTDPDAYTDGKYEEVVVNKATIDETGDNDTATVIVTCYAPVISKDATTYFERDWMWMIEKSGDETELTLSMGQTYPVNYAVTAIATSTDSAFKVYGTITVVNPNPDAPMPVTLADALSSGEVAMITADADCNYAGGSLTIPAGGTATCDYEAEPADDASGTNTATATLNGINFIATANYEFGAPAVETDECIDVTDDHYGELGTVCAGASPKTFEYLLAVGPYATCGTYEFVNIASFVTNDTDTTGSDGHMVTVNVPCGGCTLTQGYWKTHSDRGPAPYDDGWKAIGVLEEDTIFFLSGQSWYQVFWTPPAGNAYYNLAHQYMAAKLNILNGASVPTEVTAAIAQAEALFASYTPAQVAALKANNAVRKQFIGLASILDRYNNGFTGPGHCSESNTIIIARTTAHESYRIGVLASRLGVYDGPRQSFALLLRQLR